jgi:hypothetical protein
VADSKQFGGPKIRQFGDKTANQPGNDGHCAECEAMLADAIDGTLSAADQALFDTHMTTCGPCSQMLADARRGAAWLEMLRNPAPEPPAELLERILAQTSGSDSRIVPMPHAAFHGVTMAQPQQGTPALAAGYTMPATYGTVIPFRVRAAAAFRASSFGQIMLQPRLAMTAAMAFFSVALTMNLTGIHPLSLRASDLAPSSLARDFSNANASVERYYKNLRVVYELESRVHDLQTAQDNDAPAAAPASTDQPGTSAPAAQPGSAQPKAAPQPAGRQPSGNQRERGKPAPSPGTSRREDPNQTRRLLVAYTQDETSNGNPVRVERKLV